MATPTNKSASRFSTLKVFKFPTASKPPPLPPKDPYYLSNPSVSSLSQASPQNVVSYQPDTPITPALAPSPRSPSPSPSYAASRVTMAPSTSNPGTPLLTPDSAGSRRGLFKFSSIMKRPKTPKAAEATLAPDVDPPAHPDGDPDISMPWNFTHNLHVDEGYFGLPPTWSASLANLGYSPEEIATINARRQAARSTHTQSIYSLARSGTGTESPGPGYSSVHHLPRTNSPPGTLSEASLSQPSLVMPHPPRLTSYSITSHSRSTSGASRQFSESSYSPSHVDSTPLATAPPGTLGRRDTQFSRLTITQSRAGPPSEFSVSGSGSSGSDPMTESARTKESATSASQPRTPPRRAMHVANASFDSPRSPPPAYNSYRRGDLPDAEDFALPPASTSYPHEKQRLPPEAEPEREEREDEVVALEEALYPSRLAAPPRLSLDKDALSDLSSWTDALFSSLPSTSASASATPTASPSKPPPLPSTFTSRNSTAPPQVPSLTFQQRKSSGASDRSIPARKPIPLGQLPSRTLAPPAPTPPGSSANSSPLWNEVMNMVRAPEEAAKSSSLTPALPRTPTSPAPRTPTSPALLTPTSPAPPRTPTSPAAPRTPTSPAPRTPKSPDARFGPPSPASDRLLSDQLPSGKENRDSNLSTMTVMPATIARGAVARSAKANVVASPRTPGPPPSSSQREEEAPARCRTPNSAGSRSSGSSLSMATSATTAVSAAESVSSVSCALLTTPSEQDFSTAKASRPNSMLPASEVVITSAEDEDEDNEEDVVYRKSPQRPTVDVRTLPSAPMLNSAASPHVAPRYPGWVVDAVAPLADFIDEQADPRLLFGDLQEIGEGGSGSVYAARALQPAQGPAYVALKVVPLVPGGVAKLADVRRELALLRGVAHAHVLAPEGAYVDVLEDALWLRMELMERSLADVVLLVGEGVALPEPAIAQFASDVLEGLAFLQTERIAHRDVRSDNLLVGRDGAVKIADFSSAVRLPLDDPTRSDIVGVPYWQAPEMRRGPYDALRVDVWSLGATAWEMAQTEPPFYSAAGAQQLGERWPPLDEPLAYSIPFHEFLRLCSEPAGARPRPDALLQTAFVRSACGRGAVVRLLAECRAVEERLARRQSAGSDGTVGLA